MSEAPTPFITPDALLASWQGHRRLTRRVLDAFPDDRADSGLKYLNTDVYRSEKTSISTKLFLAAATMVLIIARITPAWSQAIVLEPDIYAPLSAEFQSPLTPDHQGCVDPGNGSPVYMPSLYQYPDGSLGMITIGNHPDSGDADTGDALFLWKRGSSGSWSNSAGGITPTLEGGAIPSFKEIVQKVPIPGSGGPCGSKLATYTGAFGGPATIVLDNKVYMAFLKGSSDWWSGEVWWAVSSDWGETWSVYDSPILYGFYHRGHETKRYGNACIFPREENEGCSCNEGFGGLSITTSSDAGGTWIHLYGTYFHRELEANRKSPLPSAIHYRFRYDPNHPFGFSPSKQIYYDGGFIDHSGKLVWDYDSGAPQGSDVRLSSPSIKAPWATLDRFFTSSVTRDSRGIYYMVIDGWRGNDPIFYVLSSDAVNWSGVRRVNVAAVYGRFPGKPLINNALWYGTLPAATGSTTGLFGFYSLDRVCGDSDYNGTRILPVKVSFILPEVVWRNSAGGENKIWTMNASGGFGSEHPLPAVPDTGWSIVGSGDFNSDVKTDLVWRHTNGHNYLWLMDGATVMDQLPLPFVDPSWHLAAVGDMDKDGKADLVWRKTTGETYLWFMNGATVTRVLPLPTVDPSWKIIGAADFDRDEESDLFWRRDDGANYIWFMNKLGVRQAVSTSPADTTWTAAGTGDFDGDGHGDVFWFRPSTGATYVWLMRGASVKVAAPATSVSVDWTPVGFGDMDLDGKTDILWRRDNGESYLWLMEGVGARQALPLPTLTPDWKAAAPR